MTETRDFEGLDAFARSRRSPIGYQPFVRRLVEKGHPKDAATFVPRCDANKRVDLYVECGEWRMAGKECKERGDKAKMEYVPPRLFDFIPVTLTRGFFFQATEEVVSQFLDCTGVGTATRFDEVNGPYDRLSPSYNMTLHAGGICVELDTHTKGTTPRFSDVIH